MKKRNKRRVRKISYIHFNANPIHNRVEDCTVRALACALNTVPIYGPQPIFQCQQGGAGCPCGYAAA